MMRQLSHTSLMTGAPGTFFNLPCDGSLKMAAELHKRFRMEVPGHISVMCREDTQRVSQWIDEQIKLKQDVLITKRPPALYIHGPPGHGKSHALALDVTIRRLTPTNRVLYIADCGSWCAGGVVWQYRFLLRAVVTAFINDDAVVERCRQVWNTACNEFEWHTLGNDLMTDFLPEYCKRHHLQLIAVFDQHDTLTQKQREQMPFSMIEQLLPAQWSECAGLVIVSASDDNSYYLKGACTADGSWSVYEYVSSYTPHEFVQWLAHVKLNLTPSECDELEFVTGRVPYELECFRRVKEDQRDGLTFDVTLRTYQGQRSKQIQAQCRIFLSKPTKFDICVEEQFLNAIILMDGRGEVSKFGPIVLNQQLMREKKSTHTGNMVTVVATSPLVHRVLVDYWSKFDSVTFEAAVSRILSSSEYSPKTRGRVLQRYMVRRILREKRFSFDYIPIHGDGRISRDKRKLRSLRLRDLAIVHFRGGPNLPLPRPTIDQLARDTFFIHDDDDNDFTHNVDLILWSVATRTVTLIQITLAAHEQRFEFDHAPWIEAFSSPAAASPSSSSPSVCISSGVGVAIPSTSLRSCFTCVDDSESEPVNPLPVVVEFVWLADDLRLDIASQGKSFVSTWKDLIDIDSKSTTPLFPLLNDLPEYLRTDTTINFK